MFKMNKTELKGIVIDQNNRKESDELIQREIFAKIEPSNLVPNRQTTATTSAHNFVSRSLGVLISIISAVSRSRALGTSSKE